jgi:decaprenylphospho-beta-D-erythro-pentofuranosid-2-ulose 2-reductase
VLDALGNPQSMLVLGGTSEIGLATVRALAGKRLQSVVLAGRDPASLEAAAAPLRSPGLEVATEVFDALDTAAHEAWVADVFDRHGGFDVVLLAFGVLGDQALAERDVAEAVRVVQTNYVGAVSVGLPLARRMVADGHGVLVVLSSVAGLRARRANFVYGSSKAALDAFAQGLGDMTHGTVRVVVVRPGFVKGRMTEGMDPAPMATTPDAVAQAIVGAIAGRAEVVHVPKPIGYVFAILRLLPRAVFRRLPLS